MKIETVDAGRDYVAPRMPARDDSRSRINESDDCAAMHVSRRIRISGQHDLCDNDAAVLYFLRFHIPFIKMVRERGVEPLRLPTGS